MQVQGLSCEVGLGLTGFNQTTARVGQKPRASAINTLPLLRYLFQDSAVKGMKRVKFLTPILSRQRPRIHLQRFPFPTAKPAQLLPAQRRSFLSDSLNMADHPTLVKPPPIDPSKSAIENVLELTELSAIAPVWFCASHSLQMSCNLTRIIHRTSSPTPDPYGTLPGPAVSTEVPSSHNVSLLRSERFLQTSQSTACTATSC